ncbi:AraC family transcriptional regulator [Christensenella massiliensis]|uniref:AraC family transcriptional regulator n=1 Tax=Christensenella massiliensis TaxID=1805714 RepID=A0AAU8A7A5_9FIRM
METLTKEFTTDLTEDSTWIFNTPGELTKSFLLYAQELGYFKASSNYYTCQENISSYLIMLTLAGQGTYTAGGRQYELMPGDLVFVDSMEPHTHRTSKQSKGNWHILWVQFNGITARGYYSQYKTKDIPVLDTSGNPKIQLLMEKLLSANKSKSIGAEFLTSRILVELLTELLFTARAVVSPKINMPQFIQAALSDIDAHFPENLNLEYFSDKLRLSKYHFAKEFKKYTGYSPVEYLINTRINHAKEYLQYSDLTITDISEAVGFNNTCHFINMFKQKVGVTPLKFRKQYQNVSK